MSSSADSSTSKANDYFLRLEVDGEEVGEFIDHWDTGELLFLASVVQRSSDRNWNSVARAVKLYGEQTRPSDFYTSRSCSVQYIKLLSEIEEETQKKSVPRTERETSEAMLVKNLTDKRLHELALLNQQAKSSANVLKSYIDMVENGELDDQLDDVLQSIEEKEKREEQKYAEYISKREALNSAKKLNKSRLTKGKGSKVLDSKKKNLFTEIPEDSPSKAAVAEVVKNIKKEIEEEELAASTKHIKIKSEVDSNTHLNALLDSKVTMPASVSPTSPLLTSLLRTITSTSAASPQLPPLSSSPLKDSDHGEGDHSKSEMDILGFLKSKEISPRAAVPQSPRPTPSSSPLLNSLLKNSPSSSIASKDISPKAVSSPQPFFSPSSALASATAQQLSVATSSQSLSHQFFPHEASETRKALFQSSPTSLACLAAPTLSKLLEMPPSTPGRLPPLPVLDPPHTSTTTASSPKILSPQKQADLKPKQLEFSPNRRSVEKIPVASKISPEAQTSSFDANKGKVGNIENISLLSSTSKQAVEEAQMESMDTSKETPSLEEISENLQNDTLADLHIKLEVVNQDISSLSNAKVEQHMTTKDKISGNDDFPADLLSNIKLEKIDDITDIKHDLSFFTDESLTIPKSDIDEKETSRKIFKSRTPKKTSSSEDNSVKSEEPTVLLTPSKIKAEPESPLKKVKMDHDSSVSKISSVLDSEEGLQFLDTRSEKSDELKSPASKKTKLFEYASPEKIDVSEDEMPSAVRRSGRKSKKSRGRGSKPMNPKPIEPKDQYEFSESAEENSVGYQASNALCYGSRIKESTRFEEKTTFCSQDSEEPALIANSESTSVGKKSPVKNKTENTEILTRGKSPFGTDEDVVSDSFTFDEASNSMLTEDKLKQWDESSEQKMDESKVLGNSKAIQKTLKAGDSFKNKLPLKRQLPSKSNIPCKKERKLTGSDFDELSACSRDSEDISSGWKKESSDLKDLKSNLPECKVEISDSRLSSSVIIDSEQMDDMESLQGSITTDFSPVETSEAKDEKDASQFGKQDWFQGVSPKSSEHVSQSSEESEYESDNWDSHSVSTNKSTSDNPPRTKKKERESADYKAWKKAIHIVLREASCHKYANVFLQKVTNDVAPGYSSIVYRPMDLSLIKKNIDNGTIRTTDEFHRDMLLMFQNAIMYNSSDHNVYKMAVEMQSDVIEQIKAFITTQKNGKDVQNETTSSLRAARMAKLQKGGGKQPSTSISS